MCDKDTDCRGAPAWCVWLLAGIVIVLAFYTLAVPHLVPAREPVASPGYIKISDIKKVTIVDDAGVEYPLDVSLDSFDLTHPSVSLGIPTYNGTIRHISIELRNGE